MSRAPLADGWWLPPGFGPGMPTGGVPDAAWIAALAAHLRQAGDALRRTTTVDRRIAALDAAAEHWLQRIAGHEPLVEAIAADSGLSPTMVRRCIEAEQTSSRGPDLAMTLDAELGDRRALDGFIADRRMRRHVRAVPPGLVLAVLPGNIPGLSHLPILRSLLLGSPVLAKAASGEPRYAAAYVASLAAFMPELAEAVAVVRWPRGADPLESAVAAAADAAIVFGRSETIAAWSARLPRDRPLVAHGHRVGLQLVDGAWVGRRRSLFDALALDVAMYDQAACLAPQRMLVRGAEGEAERVGLALAAALDRLHGRLPQGAGTLADEATRRRYRDELEWGDPDEARILAEGPWGMVVLDRRRPWRPTCGRRTIAISAVPDWPTALATLDAWRPWLQNAALAVPATDRRPLAEALAELGCSRICPPGAMPFPSMRWHHDGMATLAAMVRFCDVEGAAEAPLGRGWLGEGGTPR